MVWSLPAGRQAKRGQTFTRPQQPHHNQPKVGVRARRTHSNDPKNKYGRKILK
ncbi:MAG TPA: hypothetical protein P5052_01410 [Candidatus Paceibacterota bacterium]|nr:hypothetical protein [Candidatus Paceibacterota bacterium]